MATLSQSPWPGSADESSEWEVSSNECKARAAESRAKKEREKAGLPEVKLDELPSCCAPKMMNLSFTCETSEPHYLLKNISQVHNTVIIITKICLGHLRTFSCHSSGIN